MNSNKILNVLVVYDSFGDAPMQYYLISKEKHGEIFQSAIEADGIYINLNSEDGDACERLNDWLWLSENSEKCIFDKNEVIPNATKLVHTGFAC